MSNVTQLLNDVEINLLADIYLARYGFDVTTKAYRRFKNTLIIFSHDFADIAVELSEVAALDGMTAEELTAELKSTVAALPRPLHETFNKYYGTKIFDRDVAHVTMPDNLSVIDGISFLAGVFLTIILHNYNKYDRFEY